MRAAGGVAALALVVAAATAGGLALGAGDEPATGGAVDEHTLHVHEPADVIGSPTRHTGPQGRVGQFVAKCEYSHSAPDDPIVHQGHPGRSHLHDFYGAETTDAFSSAEELVEDATTCDKPADKAAYWQPALYMDGEVVVPTEIRAYYRAAPGVDHTEVVPYPFGLELIAGDPTFTEASQMDEAAGWVCGSSSRMHTEPPNCPVTAPLHMLLTFPDCWDGEHLRSDDFRSHAAYSTDGECPESHPVNVPQLMMSVKYPVSGIGHEFSLASVNVHSAHGDFLNSWDPEGLEREVTQCINRDVLCDLVSNRQEDGPFFAS